MVDLIALILVLVVVLVVFLRKTSAGVGMFALLSGVLLDQLLSTWVLNLIPKQSGTLADYLPVIVHLLITFTPVLAVLIAVKVPHHNVVLSLFSSLVLGFLVVFFGLKIVAPLPEVAGAAKNSGLLTFLAPFENVILASSAGLALAEVILSHHGKSLPGKKRK